MKFLHSNVFKSLYYKKLQINIMQKKPYIRKTLNTEFKIIIIRNLYKLLFDLKCYPECTIFVREKKRKKKKP